MKRASSDSEEGLSRGERWVSLLFPSMVAGRVFGAAISPLLFAHFPMGLVLLSPFLIHLVAVAPLVDGALYFVIALVITTGQALIGYWFGHLMGGRALEWLLQRVPFPRSWADVGLDWVRRGSIVALLAVPGPVMGTIAGVAGVRRRIFHALVVPAQAIWVMAAYMIGEALLEWIEIARTFVIAHALPLTGVTVTIMALRLGYGFVAKRKSNLEQA